MPAVSNTSPIFNLACIGRLELLHRQFSEVWIPVSKRELGDIPDAEARRIVPEAQASSWLPVRPTTEADLVRLLTVDLHSGKAEAIALALETSADCLLIDEKEGRTMARRLGLRISGVLGDLLLANRTGQIDQIKPAVLALRERARSFLKRVGGANPAARKRIAVPSTVLPHLIRPIVPRPRCDTRRSGAEFCGSAWAGQGFASPLPVAVCRALDSPGALPRRGHYRSAAPSGRHTPHTLVRSWPEMTRRAQFNSAPAEGEGAHLLRSLRQVEQLRKVDKPEIFSSDGTRKPWDVDRY